MRARHGTGAVHRVRLVASLLLVLSLIYLLLALYAPASAYSATQRLEDAAVSGQVAACGRPGKEERFISFATCNGLSNQRISLMTGVALGWLMGRSVVLGAVEEDYLARSGPVPLSVLYAAEPLARAVGTPRLYAAPPDGLAALPSLALSIHRKMHPPSYYRLLAVRHAAVPHLQFDCAFFALDAAQELDVARYLWHVHAALRYSPPIEETAARVGALVRERACRLVALHLRLEADWAQHCRTWDGGHNCLSSPARALEQLQQHGVPPGSVVFVAGLEPSQLLSEIAPALAAAYSLVTKELLVPGIRAAHGHLRDRLAAIDFAVCQQADLFIGNSVSTFSALLLLHRIDSWQPAAWHNGGGIPLHGFVPSLRWLERPRAPLAWVVPFARAADGSAGADRAEQLKAAVVSALEHTTLRPFCLYDGPEGALTAWLQARGVAVIFHKLSFETELLQRPAVQALSVEERALRAEALLAADLAMVPALQAEDAVLVTAPAVLFRADVRLEHAGPAAAPAVPVACAPLERGAQGQGQCDPGVVVVRVPALRQRHAALLQWVAAQDSPSLAALLRSKAVGQPAVALPPAWGWKPWWPQAEAEAARVVHFLGVAPQAYAALPRSAAAFPPALLERCGAQEAAACRYYGELWKGVKRA